MIKEVAAMAKIESHNTLEKILENGIIAISRGNYGDTLLRAVDAAARGGIKAVEITFEQNLAPEIAGEALDKLVRRFGTVLAVGAGTVLTGPRPPCAYASARRRQTSGPCPRMIAMAFCSRTARTTPSRVPRSAVMSAPSFISMPSFSSMPAPQGP